MRFSSIQGLNFIDLKEGLIFENSTQLNLAPDLNLLDELWHLIWQEFHILAVIIPE